MKLDFVSIFTHNISAQIFKKYHFLTMWVANVIVSIWEYCKTHTTKMRNFKQLFLRSIKHSVTFVRGCFTLFSTFITVNEYSSYASLTDATRQLTRWQRRFPTLAYRLVACDCACDSRSSSLCVIIKSQQRPLLLSRIQAVQVELWHIISIITHTYMSHSAGYLTMK